MDSGIKDVALLFNKPVLTTNCVNWHFSYPLKRIDRSLMKNIFYNRNKKSLSFQEFSNLDYKYTSLRTEREYPELKYVENNSEQLLTVGKLFFSDYKNQFLRKKTEKENKNTEYFHFKLEQLVQKPEFLNDDIDEINRMYLRGKCSFGAFYEI